MEQHPLFLFSPTDSLLTMSYLSSINSLWSLQEGLVFILAGRTLSITANERKIQVRGAWMWQIGRGENGRWGAEPWICWRNPGGCAWAGNSPPANLFMAITWLYKSRLLPLGRPRPVRQEECGTKGSGPAWTSACPAGVYHCCSASHPIALINTFPPNPVGAAETICCNRFPPHTQQELHFGTWRKPVPKAGFPSKITADDLMFGQTVPPKGDVINYPGWKCLLRCFWSTCRNHSPFTDLCFVPPSALSTSVHPPLPETHSARLRHQGWEISFSCPAKRRLFGQADKGFSSPIHSSPNLIKLFEW